MKDQLQQLIELMRKHVVKNLESIKSNERHIREVLDRPLSAERTRELNECYQLSKDLLSENNDFINLQVTLVNFTNKYKKLLDEENTVNVTAVTYAQKIRSLSREDCFKLTVESNIKFDQNHPYYEDPDFINELIAHFEQSENYEKCAQLMKLKK
ncbi:MAG TPA: hypothetical protein VIH57_04350 [Bacteroidales bacterium]